MSAETLMFLGGLSAFVLTVHGLIRRRLHESFALGWLAVATLLLVCGLFPQTIMEFAKFSKMSYAGFVLLVSLGVIYSYSFCVSISLSRLRRHNVRLTQELALLESRFRELESRLETDGDEQATTSLRVVRTEKDAA
jgi:hypothetical protein